jgi:hypothetical protein
VDHFGSFLKQEPLMHAAPTLLSLQPDLIRDGGGSIYFGVGLTTRHALSVALPFDALVFVLTAEKIRRELGLNRIYCHIADTHALSNPFCATEEVASLASKYQKLLLRVAEAVNAPVLIKLSSDFDENEIYRTLLARVETDKGEYVKRELTDILWYRQNRHVVLKLGWLIQSRGSKTGFDERLYDDEFRDKCDVNMQFAYTVSGRTFNRSRARVAPYISSINENRPLFVAGESVRSKYERGVVEWGGHESLSGVLEYYQSVMRLWDVVSATSIAPSGDVLERIQAVIDLISN